MWRLEERTLMSRIYGVINSYNCDEAFKKIGYSRKPRVLRM